MTVGNEEPLARPAEAEPRKNVFQRVAGAFFAPVETFADIARRPDILAPLILIIAIGYATTALVIPRMDFDAMMATQAEAMKKQNPNLADADIERMGRFGKAFGTVMAWLSPILTLIWYAIVAGALLLVFRLLGGEGNYKQAFSTTLYAWMPLVLFGILATIVAVSRGTFDPTQAATLVKSNPAFLVDMQEQPVLFSLLASLDIFTIWTVALLVVGFAVFTKVSFVRSAAIVVSLWLMLVVVKLGFAAFSASRMNT